MTVSRHWLLCDSLHRQVHHSLMYAVFVVLKCFWAVACLLFLVPHCPYFSSYLVFNTFYTLAVLCVTTSSIKSTLQSVATASGWSIHIMWLLSIYILSTICSYHCIHQMLMQSPHCPICKAGLPPQNPIHPNFSCEFAPVISNSFLICVGFSGAVNDLVTKYKLDKADTAAKRKCTSLEGEKLLEAVNSANVQGWVMWQLVNYIQLTILFL